MSKPCPLNVALDSAVRPEHVLAAVAESYSWNIAVDASGVRRYNPCHWDGDMLPSGWRLDVPPGGFTRQHMHLVDLRVAAIMDGDYAAHLNSQGDSEMPSLWCYLGEDLQASQRYWDGTLFSLPGAAFCSEDFQMQLNSRFYIDDEDIVIERIGPVYGAPVFNLKYTGFTLTSTSSGLTYVESHETYSELLETAWLEKHVPDWYDRYALAETLGISGSQQIHYLFGLSDTPSCDIGVILPSSTFD